MALLPHIEIEPEGPAEATMIWLHGLGADGQDFVPVAEALGLPQAGRVRFLFPHAPRLPVTINGGMVMPAWYDILEIQIERRVDVAQLQASAAAIAALIEREEQRGIAAERILVAGFSQGGAVAYETALAYPRRLGGLIALSSYFATADRAALSPANASLPVLICHGSQDPIVPEALGRQSVESLKRLGLSPSYRTYPMAHEVCMEEIAEIGAWVRERLYPARPDAN